MRRRQDDNGPQTKVAKLNSKFMHVSRNYPIDDYFRHTLHNNTTKHEQIHCSIVCFGDCRTAKFFTDLSDLATKYKLNHPVQLNLSGEDSIKQIAPGDEFSYLLTTSGKCYSIGSGCAMGSRMLRSTTEPKLVHNVIDIVHVSHAYQRTVFINSKKITNSNSQGSGIAYVSGTYRSDDGSFGDLLPSVYSAPYPMCTTPYPSVTSSHIGPSHTVFISKSGFLLGCGNKHVLGLHVRSIGIINNDFKAQREIVSIFNERVLQVACGESYTAVLSELWCAGKSFSQPIVTVDRWNKIQVNVSSLHGGRHFLIFQRDKRFELLSNRKENVSFDGIKRIFTGENYAIGIDSENRIVTKIDHTDKVYETMFKDKIQLGDMIDEDFELSCGNSHGMAILEENQRLKHTAKCTIDG